MFWVRLVFRVGQWRVRNRTPTRIPDDRRSMCEMTTFGAIEEPVMGPPQEVALLGRPAAAGFDRPTSRQAGGVSALLGPGRRLPPVVERAERQRQLLPGPLTALGL